MIRKIRQIIHMFGFDITRFPSPIGKSLKQILSTHHFNVILDIGANAGFYAKELRELGYKGKIISFEPLEKAFLDLQQYIRRSGLDHVAVNCALGEFDGEIEINISENSVSSSLLEVTPALMESAPTARYLTKQKTAIHRLDTIIHQYCDPAKDVVFMKIDAQGYEKNILDGAEESLKKIQGLQLEVSIVELYKGEMLLDEMIPFIKSKGFELFLIIPGFTDPQTGQLLQVDCVFVRREKKYPEPSNDSLS